MYKCKNTSNYANCSNCIEPKEDNIENGRKKARHSFTGLIPIIYYFLLIVEVLIEFVGIPCCFIWSCVRLERYNQKKIAEAASVQTEIYTEVVNKRTYNVPAGKVSVKKYEVTVNIDGTREKVNVPADTYNGVIIGDDIEVTVYTSEDKTTDVKLKEIK